MQTIWTIIFLYLAQIVSMIQSLILFSSLLLDTKNDPRVCAHAHTHTNRDKSALAHKTRDSLYVKYHKLPHLIYN